VAKLKKALRPYPWEKIAFLEDANEDSTITSSTFRVLQKIVAAFNRRDGFAKCARTFIVDRVPVSVKTVQRATKALLDQGRITIVGVPKGRAPTRYGINWWFRGADKVRAANGGMPIRDVRAHAVEGTMVTGFQTVEGTFTPNQNVTNVHSTPRRVDMVSPKPFLSSKKKRKDESDFPRPGLAAGAEVVSSGWTWEPNAEAWAADTTVQLVQITASEIVAAESGGHVLALYVVTPHGAPTGALRIHLESKDAQRAEAGLSRFDLLRFVLAVDHIDDTAELHGVPFLISVRGDLLPDPDNRAAVADRPLYREADVLTGLSALDAGARRYRNNGDTLAMNAEVVAELRRLRAVSVRDTRKMAA